MIPTFLHSLATQVRALVASGKALHVNNQTADELELLAGLTWPAPLPPHVLAQRETEGAWVNRDGTVREHQPPMQPADIAWAWLKLSLGRESCKTFGQIDFLGVVEQDAARAAECAELVAIAAGMTTGCSDMGCSQIADPHRGTCEGARAAWGHIASCMLVHAGDKWDRYRRELEVM